MQAAPQPAAASGRPPAAAAPLPPAAAAGAALAMVGLSRFEALLGRLPSGSFILFKGKKLGCPTDL